MSSFDTSVLYEDGNHRYLHLGWEEKEEKSIVQTNQYMIIHNGEVVLMDPGGAHVFPRVLANVAEIVDIGSVSQIFYSHQDPDVSSGITLWLSIAEKAKAHISGLWTRFLPHFGIYETSRIVAIPDRGGDLTSRILFSGDIGAAVFPEGKRYPAVENFDDHLRYMEGFHKRYMASNSACRRWVDAVSKLKIDAIAPQHGAVIKGDDVDRFLNWFGNLKCGVDIMDQLFR
jgi:flavorubredoxin